MELILICGIPGKGKTTLAKRLAGSRGKEIAADDYPGLYDNGFQKELLPLAHEWCERQAETWMRKEVETIIVHNTFLQEEHRRPYKALAMKHGYSYQVILCQELILPTGEATRSIHNVPEEAIQRMEEIMDF